MPAPRHTFDLQLRSLEQRLLRMGSFVESMLEDAVRALTEQDVKLAQEVTRRDDVADELDLDIESSCMHMLALQQPMSIDLRVIGTVMKITTDLERIADYAVDIAQTGTKITSFRFHHPLVRIPHLAEVAVRMLRGSLEAFVARDLQKVGEVVALDDKVDELYDQTWHTLVTEMRDGATDIEQGTQLVLVARYLERIADHAVNVAERVAYMETGELRQLATSHRDHP